MIIINFTKMKRYKIKLKLFPVILWNDKVKRFLIKYNIYSITHLNELPIYLFKKIESIYKIEIKLIC